MPPDRGKVVLEAVSIDSQQHSPSLDIEKHEISITDATIASTPPAVSTVPPHLSHDPTTNAKVSDPFQFGNRFLTNDHDPFEYNAWDHVEPDAEYEAYALEQYAKQRDSPVSEFDKHRFNDKPEKWWDLFYKQKSATFFKDRKWLGQEFPILKDVTQAEAGRKVVVEVGAGAGNTAFPIMRVNENDMLEMWAVDFSKKAVEVMRSAEDYGDTVGVSGSETGERRRKRGTMRAEVWDVAGDELPEGLTEGSVDVVIMIFIFSALSPRQWTRAVQNIHRFLRPGGEVLFRDYGRGDLAQVRFKAGRYMEDNFYVRGDGTRVYFFEREELEHIWLHSGPSSTRHATNEFASSQIGLLDASTAEREAEHTADRAAATRGADGCASVSNSFTVVNLDVDRRMIVNRQRRLKMYRCWIQGRFKKREDG